MIKGIELEPDSAITMTAEVIPSFPLLLCLSKTKKLTKPTDGRSNPL